MTSTSLARLGALAFAAGVAVISFTAGKASVVAGLCLCTFGGITFFQSSPRRHLLDDAHFVDRQGKPYSTGNNYVEKLLDRLNG